MKLKTALFALVCATTLSACNVVFDETEIPTETLLSVEMSETAAETLVSETTVPTETTITIETIPATNSQSERQNSSNNNSSNNITENVPAATEAVTQPEITTETITETMTDTIIETTIETTTAPTETIDAETTTVPQNGTVDDFFVLFEGDLGGGLYDGDLKDGKPEGQGTFSSYGKTYTGAFVNGLPEGQGVLVYDDGMKYKGSFKGGVYDGYGEIVFVSGSEYEGSFKNGAFDGQGTMSHVNGDVYTGSFKNGEYDGYGVYKNADGYTYEGSWAGGEKHGKGTGYAYVDNNHDVAREGKNYIINFNYENGLMVPGTYEMIVYRKDGTVETEYRETAPSRDHFLGEWEEDPVTTRRIVITYLDGSKDEFKSDIIAGTHGTYYGRIHTDVYGVVTEY